MQANADADENTRLTWALLQQLPGPFSHPQQHSLPCLVGANAPAGFPGARCSRGPMSRGALSAIVSPILSAVRGCLQVELACCDLLHGMSNSPGLILSVFSEQCPFG